MCITCVEHLRTLIPAARQLNCFTCDHGHASMVRRPVAIRFFARFEKDTTLIEGADPARFVLLVTVLDLRISETYGKFFGIAMVLLPLLWPYLTASLEHDAQNNYVTLSTFPKFSE